VPLWLVVESGEQRRPGRHGPRRRGFQEGLQTCQVCRPGAGRIDQRGVEL
jgi:hypothetical protein